jgi:hypothetical protein
MHRYHTSHRTPETGREAVSVIPSYFLGRPSRVYVARYRRASATAVDERR